MKKYIALFLTAVLIITICLPLTGCSTVNAADLMENIESNEVSVSADLEENTDEITDFCVRLFQAGYRAGENTLISPLSVLYALSMTANGADGATLAQMEATLGLDTDSLNAWLHAFQEQLSSGKKYKLNLANSIWFRDTDSLTVEKAFLQCNADYYSADIYKAPFDQTTVSDINQWVKQQTDGMIDGIIDEIPESTVMYLINALAFEAQWREIYEESQIRDGIFTTEEGLELSAELMYSTESIYLHDDLAGGFIKYYAGGKYAFAALLPNEGVSVSQYMDSLTGSHLQILLNRGETRTVTAAIPKFEAAYSAELSDVLAKMGMPDAFDGAVSDFSRMAQSTDGNLYISKVIHKTYISVDAQGTKAAAVSAVAMDTECAAEVTDPVEVILDRPFVYMLIDVQTGLPFFIGTMMNINAG